MMARKGHRTQVLQHSVYINIYIFIYNIETRKRKDRYTIVKRKGSQNNVSDYNYKHFWR